LESARSIGCQIDDSTISAVIREDKDVITQLLVDLLKARAVHSKEADQFGSHVFSSPSVLLSLFGVRVSDHKMQSKDEKDDVDAMTAETATTLYKNDPVQKVDTKGIALAILLSIACSSIKKAWLNTHGQCTYSGSRDSNTVV
jgi:hypothetical protein